MAFVLSSLSGNLISAASAGWAPTNSGEVSAIASAYQIVSATATQLNAGTAYLTSVNETPISASRAGNAANASLANSAWYDGTGRLISSLPDEATVSSIASAYAESAASGKLDSSASSSFYTTANESGFLTGLPIDISARDLSASRRVRANETGSDLYGNFDYAGMYFRSGAQRPYNIGIDNTGANFYIATAKNGFERIYASSIQSWNGKLDSSASSSYYTTANESGFVDSAYVNSAVSGKADSSALSAYALSSDVSGVIDTVSSNSASWAGGGESIPFVGNYWDSAESATVVITADVASVGSVAYVKYNGNVVNTYSGITDTLGNIHLGVASFISPGAEINGKNAGGIPYTLSFAPASSMWKTSVAATGIFSPLQYGTGAGMFMDSNNFKGYLKGNEWFVADNRYGYARGEVHYSRGCRVIVEHTGGAGAVLSAKNNSANVTLNSTAYGTAQMAVTKSQAYVQVQRGNSAYKYNSAKLDTDYLKFYNGMTTGYLDPEDTASGTAYMPAETEYMYISSIPYWNGKVDQSAMSSYVPYSSLEYNTASAISGINGSALAAGSTYSAGEGIDITDDVISVEAPVDIVAGPGIVIDNPDGNTLRVSQAYPTDETVLWDGSTTGSDGDITLSESMANFERIGIFFSVSSAYVQGTYWYGGKWQFFEAGDLSITKKFCISDNMNNGDSANTLNFKNQSYTVSNDNLTFTLARSTQLYYNGSSWALSTTAKSKIYKVVGIHRIANN